MVVKTIMALSLYLIPYLAVVLIAPGSLPILFGLYILMGFGKTFIGTSVMHDALHGSYSNSKWVNNLIGSSAYIIGVDPDMWKFQHNVLHHTYTNIEHIDEDIEPRFVFRFTPYQPQKWFHNYQHIYAPIFYSIMTLFWVTTKEYIRIFSYREKGLIKSNGRMVYHFAKIIAGKIFYFGLFLFLPMYLLPVSWGMVILLFVTMHLVSGLLLSIIFQPAHVMTTNEFIDSHEENTSEKSWFLHQLCTTCNYGSKQQWVYWFTGGLNYQVEHHLFPYICHIHYKKLSEIVKETTAEFNLPYFSEDTFGSAISNHFHMLKLLGRDEFSLVKQPQTA